MSDVDLLRRAAALMRYRAEGATPGPWCDAAAGRVRVTSDQTVVAITPFDSIAENDGAYIASWHPAVALAVADWLDQYADAMAEIGAPAREHWNAFPAFRVAAVYLGEPE